MGVGPPRLKKRDDDVDHVGPSGVRRRRLGEQQQNSKSLLYRWAIAEADMTDTKRFPTVFRRALDEILNDASGTAPRSGVPAGAPKPRAYFLTRDVLEYLPLHAVCSFLQNFYNMRNGILR